MVVSWDLFHDVRGLAHAVEMRGSKWASACGYECSAGCIVDAFSFLVVAGSNPRSKDRHPRIACRQVSECERQNPLAGVHGISETTGCSAGGYGQGRFADRLATWDYSGLLAFEITSSFLLKYVVYLFEAKHKIETFGICCFLT